MASINNMNIGVDINMRNETGYNTLIIDDNIELTEKEFQDATVDVELELKKAKYEHVKRQIRELISRSAHYENEVKNATADLEKLKSRYVKK